MSLTSDALAGLQAGLLADLRRFAPELVVSGTIVLLLLCRLLKPLDRAHLGGVALGGAVAALLALFAPALGLWPGDPSGPAFAGLLALDGLATYLRGLLLVFLVLAVILTRLTGLPDADDSADFYVLLFGGVLGMLVMSSANHLLMVFLGAEMASLPGYALSGFLKGRRTGSEAAVKYVVYGAAASGVMLFGISLLAGAAGTGHLPAVAAKFAAGVRPELAAGLLFLLVGLGFKLAVVPVQFWLPDVLAGACAEVGAMLAVASKIAAAGLTLRVLLALQAACEPVDPTLLPRTVGLGLAVVAALTATLGNLAALPQTDLKRLLAYSTIAHAGYLLMGLATLTRGGGAAVLVYLAAYLPMNLGAFAVVAVVRNRTGAETVDAVRGLLARSPGVAVALSVFLLSLLGLPPLAGFAGKFLVFEAVYDAGRGYARQGPGWLGPVFTALLAVGVANTVVSAGYYLKVLRAATLDETPAADEKGQPVPLGEPVVARWYLGLLAVAVVVLGVAWGPVADLAAKAMAR
ncbi:MAG: NADH-quinone oxidoreductase subunit N [Gemmataceae bacterium]